MLSLFKQGPELREGLFNKITAEYVLTLLALWWWLFFGYWLKKLKFTPTVSIFSKQMSVKLTI